MTWKLNKGKLYDGHNVKYWANKSPSVFFEGRTYKQWAEDLGIHLNTVRNRLKQGKHPNKLIIIKA